MISNENEPSNTTTTTSPSSNSNNNNNNNTNFIQKLDDLKTLKYVDSKYLLLILKI